MNLSINTPSRFLLDVQTDHPASFNPFGSSKFLLPNSMTVNDDDDDEEEDYTRAEITQLFKERLKAEHIFKTYQDLSTKFKFNNIDEKIGYGNGNGNNTDADMVEKIKGIRDRVVMFESDGSSGGLNKKNTKTLYETKDFIIESPSYSYIDDKDTFYKIYAINLQRFEIDKDAGNMDKRLLLFLAVVHELMREEFIYHQKTYELVQQNDTIEKMATYIKDHDKDGCNNIRFGDDGILKTSCENVLKRITQQSKSKSKMGNYKVVIPEIYETNMNETGFYYDKARIYYYMRMSKVPNTHTTRLQSIEDCHQIKPLLPIIDSFLILNGISHNDYSTKGNVFVDVKGKKLYIIDFGTSGDYVYNAGAKVHLSTNINSLNITCDKKEEQTESKDYENVQGKSKPETSKKKKPVKRITINKKSMSRNGLVVKPKRSSRTSARTGRINKTRRFKPY
jgi:hypothetical protein